MLECLLIATCTRHMWYTHTHAGKLHVKTKTKQKQPFKKNPILCIEKELWNLKKAEAVSRELMTEKHNRALGNNVCSLGAAALTEFCLVIHSVPLSTHPGSEKHRGEVRQKSWERRRWVGSIRYGGRKTKQNKTKKQAENHERASG